MVVSAYEDKTGRNGNDRGKEHLAHFTKKWEENSVMWLHSLYHHEGRTDVGYGGLQVFKVFQNEDNLNTIVWCYL